MGWMPSLVESAPAGRTVVNAMPSSDLRGVLRHLIVWTWVVLWPTGACPEDLFDRMAERPRFEHLTSADGLPHNVVFTLARDATGFLWMGTQGGPTRYDGIEFVPWRHRPEDPDSLALDDVSLIVPDGEDSLWFATWGRGLDRFDLESERFEHHPARPGDPGALQDGRVQALLLTENHVWAGTFEGGLSRLDRRGGGLTTLRHDPDDPGSLPNDRIWSLVQDPEGGLWVGTQTGLCRLRDGSAERLRCERQPFDRGEGRTSEIRALELDRHGALWVGTGAGVFRRPTPEAPFEPFLPPAMGLAETVVNSLFEDQSGDLWIGTNGGGLLRCPDRTGTCERFLHRADDPTSLGYDDIRALLEDDDGTLWIATRGGGVDRLALHPSPFLGLRRQPVGPLPSGYVWSFAQDPAGQIWIGTGQGLVRAEAERFVSYSAFEPPAGHPDGALPDGHVSDLLFDRDGMLWVATFDGGLARFLDDDRGFYTYRHVPGDPHSLPSDHLHRLYQSSDGTLWIGSRHGLARYRPSSDDFEVFYNRPTAGPDGEPPRDDVIRELLEDPEDFLWVGTDGGGLSRFHPSEGSLEHVTAPLGTVGERIHALHLDGQNNLWVATDLGLARRLTEDRFEVWNDRHGLPSPHILSIQEDSQGFLWLGTDRGLARWDPRQETATTFRMSDGLPGNELNPRAAFRDRDGRMFFGGIDGLTVFDPLQIRDLPNTAPVVLTGFYRFNRPAELGRPPSKIEKITLPPTDDFISFTFAHLDLDAPRANRYRYRLEGFDRDWIDAGARRRADYTNLDSGDYVFRVEAANSHGVWSERSLSVALRITPPYWQTWWFRGLSGLFFLSLVFAIHRSRVAVLREQERQLQQRVKSALAELDASEQRYRQLFERNLAGVLRAGEDGKILDCNPAFAHIFGYESPAACRQGLVLDLGAESPLFRQLETASPVAGFEQIAQRRDGSQVVLLWNASLVPGEADASILEATVIDITELRRTEDTLLRTKKLESLGLMAGGVAHDFNNLLMVITGATEMLRNQLPADAESQLLSYLQMIAQATRRASRLSQQMLAYVGQGSLSQEPVDFSDLVRELATGLEAIVAPGRLELELEPHLPAVLADANQLRQVVTQLVTNAAEASTSLDQPVVRIGTSRVERGAGDFGQAVFDQPPAAGTYVELAIRDHGDGMDEATRSRIFDPFFTTKFTGRGLGLAVVWGIARAHRGALEVESEPGRGSEIRLYLPVEGTTPAP